MCGDKAVRIKSIKLAGLTDKNTQGLSYFFLRQNLVYINHFSAGNKIMSHPGELIKSRQSFLFSPFAL